MAKYVAPRGTMNIFAGVDWELLAKNQPLDGRWIKVSDYLLLV